MRGNSTSVVVGSCTDRGQVRVRNQDSIAIFPVRDGRHLFILADGAGGEQHGEAASRHAVAGIGELFFEIVTEQPNMPLPEALRQATSECNTEIFQVALERGAGGHMGTTVVAALLDGMTLHVVWVGDSRAYLVRGNKEPAYQLTTDHSKVEQLLAQGLISPHEAQTHPERHVLTRSLGGRANVQADVVTRELHVDDTVVLCSDGLTGAVSDAEITAHVRGKADLERAASSLVKVANKRGGTDNISVVVFRVVEAASESSHQRKDQSGRAESPGENGFVKTLVAREVQAAAASDLDPAGSSDEPQYMRTIPIRDETFAAIRAQINESAPVDKSAATGWRRHINPLTILLAILVVVLSALLAWSLQSADTDANGSDVNQVGGLAADAAQALDPTHTLEAEVSGSPAKPVGTTAVGAVEGLSSTPVPGAPAPDAAIAMTESVTPTPSRSPSPTPAWSPTAIPADLASPEAAAMVEMDSSPAGSTDDIQWKVGTVLYVTQDTPVYRTASGEAGDRTLSAGTAVQVVINAASENQVLYEFDDLIWWHVAPVGVEVPTQGWLPQHVLAEASTPLHQSWLGEPNGNSSTLYTMEAGLELLSVPNTDDTKVTVLELNTALKIVPDQTNGRSVQYDGGLWWWHVRLPKEAGLAGWVHQGALADHRTTTPGNGHNEP